MEVFCGVVEQACGLAYIGVSSWDIAGLLGQLLNNCGFICRGFDQLNQFAECDGGGPAEVEDLKGATTSSCKVAKRSGRRVFRLISAIRLMALWALSGKQVRFDGFS